MFGETLTVIDVVEFATEAVPLAHCPAVNADPPMLPVTPESVPATENTAPLFSIFFHWCAVESAYNTSMPDTPPGEEVSVAWYCVPARTPSFVNKLIPILGVGTIPMPIGQLSEREPTQKKQVYGVSVESHDIHE